MATTTDAIAALRLLDHAGNYLTALLLIHDWNDDIAEALGIIETLRHTLNRKVNKCK